MGGATVVTGGDSRPLIQVRGFSKLYRRHPAVQGVDLTVHPGQIYGLIGPDGAGKSSLMKALAGVLTFDTGKVEVFGIRLDSEEAAERVKDRIGFMPQGLGLNLYPELSVEENIDFFARLRLVPAAQLAERKQRLLAMTRLDKFRDRAMKNLSGGMKQKLGLACTLIHEPELLILDEPTTGVDPVSRRDFWAILASLLRERSITALVSTAYMDEASRFHRLSLLYEGRVLAEGEPDEIQSLVPGSLVTLRAEPQTKALVRLKARFPQVEALGSWLRVFSDATDADAAVRQVQEALEAVTLCEIYAGQPELEDIFIALLRSQTPSPRPPDPPSLRGEGSNLAPQDVYSPALSDRAVNDPSGRLRRPSCGRETTWEWTPHGTDKSAGSPFPAKNLEHTAIEAQELTRDFGRFRAVDRVSFRVGDGEIFGLLGANGAGKTTIIKMLTGILQPSEGRGHVAGVDMRRAGQAIKKRIGYVSQSFSLYQDLTVLENMHLYAGIYGLSRAEGRKQIDRVLSLGGLAGHESARAGSLPMGLRQRLALGCALIHRPEILFLDEPTSGVDPIGRRQFWDILFELSRQEGVAILITTHYMSEAEHCDRLALMYAGKIVADASPEEMKRQVEREAGRVLELTTDRPAQAVEWLSEQGFGEPALFGKHIHLLSRQPESDMRRIPELLAANGIQVSEIVPRPLSMEDVFVYRVTSLEQQESTPSAGAGR